MKYLKMLGIAAVAALPAFLAGSASATTLEVKGVAQNQAVTFYGSSLNSMKLARTDGSMANTCTDSSLQATTEAPFTSTALIKTVSATVSELKFEECTKAVQVHKAGKLSIAYSGGVTGTDGTVTSSGAEITVGSPFGTLNCKTGEGVDIGTLTGQSSGFAGLDIKAVLNCGFLVPSAVWEGGFTILTPVALGVIE
ncbi:MAG: hypothetical protein M3Y75_06245 [Actinomycetota bacterium]|nr:hypothetical protein [Actinomycetota bacterium]